MKLFKRDYYEKLFLKEGKMKPKTVRDYQILIDEYQKKIGELQDACAHTRTEVGFYSWGPGAMQPYDICKECYFPVKWASPEDSEKLWNKYYGQK